MLVSDLKKYVVLYCIRFNKSFKEDKFICYADDYFGGSEETGSQFKKEHIYHFFEGYKKICFPKMRMSSIYNYTTREIVDMSPELCLCRTIEHLFEKKYKATFEQIEDFCKAEKKDLKNILLKMRWNGMLELRGKYYYWDNGDDLYKKRFPALRGERLNFRTGNPTKPDPLPEEFVIA